MKKILSLFMVALFATAMVSCSKEDNSNTSGNTGGNSGGGSTPELVQNMLIIGSQQYQMHPTLSVTNEDYYLFTADDTNRTYEIIADVPLTLLNQTIDLAQLNGVDRFYIRVKTDALSFALQTGSQQAINAINDEPVDAVFSQGTLQFSKENGVFSLRVSGTLTNGIYVGFMMSVPETDIEAMDYQIIVDGRAYSAECLAWHKTGATLSYEMLLYSNDGPYVRVEVEPAAFVHHIDLTSTTSALKYRVTINFWDQDSTATQDAFTGTVESSYWDIGEQASHPVTGCLFTRGSLYVDEDEYAIGFSLMGSLTNGRSVSAQVRISKSEIQDQGIR